MAQKDSHTGEASEATRPGAALVRAGAYPNRPPHMGLRGVKQFI